MDDDEHVILKPKPVQPISEFIAELFALWQNRPTFVNTARTECERDEYAKPIIRVGTLHLWDITSSECRDNTMKLYEDGNDYER